MYLPEHNGMGDARIAVLFVSRVAGSIHPTLSADTPYSYATGESYPEPHSWVVGGYMYGFGPSHFTACLVSKDRKYVVGDYCSRPEVWWCCVDLRSVFSLPSG